jgi:zinc protease
MTKWTSRFAVMIALVPSLSWAGDAPTPRSSPTVGFRLRNGLRVYVEERHRLPLVGFTMAFAAGGQREEPGTYGFAHLFEHMMFNGTNHISKKQHETALEAVGALEDATTSFDVTQYYALAPSAELESVVWLESDRMGFLVPALTEERLQAQKNDVLNELRESVYGDPYGRADKRVFELAYPSPHPYFGRVIGLEADIDAASIARVVHFFETYYVPANAVLVVVGDVSPGELRPLLERYFGGIPGGRAPPLPSPRMTPIEEPPGGEAMAGDVGATRISYAWPVPPVFSSDHTEDAALDILEALLGDQRFGIVPRRMMQEQPLLADVKCINNRLRLGGLFRCDLTLPPHGNPARVRAAFDAVLADLARSPPSREIDAARVAWRANMLRDDQSYLSRSRSLAWYAVVAGDAARAASDMAAHDQVTPEEVGRAVETHLLAGRRYVVTVAPKGKL